MRLSLGSVVLALALVVGVSAPAAAQIEVGASLIGATVFQQTGSDTTTVIGVPTGSFGLLTPGVYVSWFLSKSVAAEGTVGLLYLSQTGDSAHLVNASGQVAWFVKGEAKSSPYIFGSVGVIHVTDSGADATYGVGGGYRFKLGDRLTMRLQGRYTRVQDEEANVFDFGVSIGGLFGKKR